MQFGEWFKTLFFRKRTPDLHEQTVDSLFADGSDVWNEEDGGNSHPADKVFAEDFENSRPRAENVDRILSTRKGTAELLASVKEQGTKMKLIVGLGNPGAKYVGTRHNVGYEVLAEAAKRFGDGRTRSKFQGEVMEGSIAGQKVVFLSPVTYMNLSGQSVRPCMDFYRVNVKDVLIICDDVHLPTGHLRIRTQGSAGGQKGLADCIRALGTENVPRLRVGVGEKPAGWEMADYVLSKYNKADRELIDVAVQLAADAVESWVKEGVDRCMTRFNGN